ncbi:MAG: GNAT family N-acetyltransferase [Thermoleophilaceae bacterium]|nr:GNAT family N-acetyltransferase [Thermoleophilaceae bacterium]
MQLRLARPEDRAFLVEMARLACTLENRPLPSPDAPDVIALMPEPDTAVIATDDFGRRVGAAWWHVHEPPLLCGANGEPLPELVMAVVKSERGQGIGAALVDALADEAARSFGALTLNVHIRNPAARLYTRTGFRVAGAGRGEFGVAMTRPLQAPDAADHPQRS